MPTYTPFIGDRIRARLGRRRLVLAIYDYLVNHPSGVWRSRRSRERAYRFASESPGLRFVSVGSGTRDYGRNVVHLDIERHRPVQVLGSGLALPFRDRSFDGAISQAVMEYMERPHEAAREIDRVLKPGGRVYVEAPFMVPYYGPHPAYHRFTVNGVRALFPDYEQLEGGVCIGPGSALAEFLPEFFGVLFSFRSRVLYRVLIRAFTFACFWVRWLDVLLEGDPHAPSVAYGVYFVGRKPPS